MYRSNIFFFCTTLCSYDKSLLWYSLIRVSQKYKMMQYEHDFYFTTRFLVRTVIEPPHGCPVILGHLGTFWRIKNTTCILCSFDRSKVALNYETPCGSVHIEILVAGKRNNFASYYYNRCNIHDNFFHKCQLVASFYLSVQKWKCVHHSIWYWDRKNISFWFTNIKNHFKISKNKFNLHLSVSWQIWDPLLSEEPICCIHV